MPRPALVHLISAHPLWLDAYSQVLTNFRREIEVVPVLADDSLRDKVERAVASGNIPDLAVVALDTPASDGMRPVRAVRQGGYTGPILVLCSRYDLPDQRDLMAENVRGILSSLQGLQELEASVCAILDDLAEPLLQQQLREARNRNGEPLSRLLSDREKTILRLVAEDLTDREIAEQLGISTRTVSLHLRHIYTKLGVRGRAGATAVGIMKGLI
jgi:DNA-binding NarL/FixJ family response regulator